MTHTETVRKRKQGDGVTQKKRERKRYNTKIEKRENKTHVEIRYMCEHKI